MSDVCGGNHSSESSLTSLSEQPSLMSSEALDWLSLALSLQNGQSESSLSTKLLEASDGSVSSGSEDSCCSVCVSKPGMYSSKYGPTPALKLLPSSCLR
eukprot:313640-Rhodomonas_salina.4